MKKTTFLLVILAGLVWGCTTDALQSDFSTDGVIAY